MKKRMIYLLSIMALLVLGASIVVVYADGTEQLGAPSIAIMSGNGLVTAGTGLFNTSTSGSITVEVPADATVNQVLLYWGDRYFDPGDADDTVTVNGNSVTGVLIGGPQTPVPDFGVLSVAFRADITGLGIVGPGANIIDVSDLGDFTAPNGATVVVIFDSPSESSAIDIRDGVDYAHADEADPGDDYYGTEPQTFSFASAGVDRAAELNLVVGDVQPNRDTIIEITVEGQATQQLKNMLSSQDGSFWDNFTTNVDIPAGAGWVTVEVISDPDGANSPASLFWVVAALSVEDIDVEEGTGRFTGGGHQIRVDGVRVTRGLTIHCDLLLSNNLEINWGGNSFHMLEHMTTVECSDDPDIIQAPPAAPLDTLVGVGAGRFNNEDGFTIEFTLVDAGEPGDSDKASFLVYETANPPNVILDVQLQVLDGGNLQAHYDQPHK